MASDEKLGKTMLLPLAEKMAEKFVNENKIDSEAGTDIIDPGLCLLKYLYFNRGSFNEKQVLEVF